MPSIAILSVLSAVALAVGQWFIWSYAPLEETMGVVQKIFYIHMPLAWWSFVSFFVVFAASVRHLMKRDAGSDILAGAAAELGVLMSGLALVSGSIWGGAAWTRPNAASIRVTKRAAEAGLRDLMAVSFLPDMEKEANITGARPQYGPLRTCLVKTGSLLL